jgi:hypothetical protein
MNKCIRLPIALVLLIALLAMSTGLVAAKELTYLDIGGPGIDGTQTLSDPTGEGGFMRKIESTGFLDLTSLVKPPADLSGGYTITAYLNLDGEVVPFVRMEYFRGAAGQKSYVHYTGRYNGTSLQPADEWAVMNPDAEIAINALAAENGITLQSAVVAGAGAGSALEAGSRPPASAPVAVSPVASAAKPPAVNMAYPLLALTAFLAVLAAAIWFATRRREAPQAAHTGDD